ncbi:MAG TPA: RNA methyltransferase [Candidatus Dormibacteraeota bacterium]|nr:RNA methyltransferase [Candidatus Dormibacteraeota bacterium]
MATATRDADPAARFLARALGEPPGPGKPDLAALLGGLGMPTPAACSARLLVSGWPDLEGVVVIFPEPAPNAEVGAVLAAASERALRDLLLAFPSGRRARVRAVGTWLAEAMRDVMDVDEESTERGQGVPVVRLRAVKPGGGGPGRTLGRDDELVSRLRELTRPPGRRRLGQFVAEGPLLVRRALDDGLPVAAVVHTADLVRAPAGVRLVERARELDVPCHRASDGLLGSLTPTRPLPPVLAAVHLRLRDAGRLFTGPTSVVLVAENLQNPDNLGMVLRTADAAGVEAVVVAEADADPLHRNCVRAARGAVGRLPVLTCADAATWLRAARGRGLRVVGATARGATDLYRCPLEPPAAIVVGNELSGLSPEVLDACDEHVRIPMAPGQDSLNVGVAAGVILYELLRRRLAQSDAGPA